MKQISGFNLLCLPCAGASASMYLRWNRLLPDWLNVIPLELPGRGTRLDQPSIKDFSSQVDGLLDDYQALLQPPFAIFGHSMGGLLAYGMAQAMAAKQLPMPSTLLLSACSAPHRFDPSRFPNPQNREALIADLRRLGGTPEALFHSPELLDMTLDILAADYQLLKGISAQTKDAVAIPIEILAGREDELDLSTLLAWQDCTTEETTFRQFDGGHFYIQTQEAQVLAYISQLLSPYATEARALAY